MRKETTFQLDDFLPYLLNRAAEVTSIEFQQYYKKRYGMLRTEWRVLFHLGRYGPLTAKTICDRADIHKTKVSRAVAALESRRFITRHTVAEDRRHAVLTLTKLGTSAFEDLAAAAEEYNTKLMAECPAEDIAAARRVLLHLAAKSRKPSERASRRL